MLESSSHCSLREKMIEKGDNGIRTVECLRGRLLAERVASKAAKEEADLMAKRLDELEKQVAEEIKSRNRAEKRLKYALKKLKSLKLLNLSESSAGSSESRKTNSGTVDSSTQCRSGGEMDDRRVVGAKDVEGDDVLGSSSGDSANQMVSQEGSWSSVGTAHSRSKEVPLQDEDSGGRDHEEWITDSLSQASHNVDGQNNAMQQAEVHSNDKLALVPVNSTPLSSTTCHSDGSNANVQNVLLALRHVKEQLQYSMEQRGAVLPYPKALYGQKLWGFFR